MNVLYALNSVSAVSHRPEASLIENLAIRRSLIDVTGVRLVPF